MGISRVFFVFIFILLTGCISYKDTLSFKDNFSGNAGIEISVSKLLARQLDKEFNINRLKKQINKEKNGITLKSFNRVETGNLVTYIFKMKFRSLKDLNNFSLDYFNIENPAGLSPETHLFNISIKREKEKIYWVRNIKLSSAYSKKAEFPEFLSALLSNYVWEYRVKFPYRVISTNGIIGEDKRTVNWKFDLLTITTEKDIKLKAVIKEPSFFERILRLIHLK